MANIEHLPPTGAAQQIAATLAGAAARQPNLPLIRAAVAARYPHLTEAEQDALADQVEAEMRRARVTVGFAGQAACVATADLTKAAA